MITRREVVPAFLEKDPKLLRRRFSQVKSKRYHVDVMDGTFTPYRTAPASSLRGLKKRITVHFMVDRPSAKLGQLQGVAEEVIAPIESVGKVAVFVHAAHARGMRVGLSINPDTPFRRILPHLGKLDSVMVMTVNPGRQGQPFVRRALGKVRALRRRFPTLPIAVDGGVNSRTMRAIIGSGADILVIGSAIVNAADPQAELRKLQKDVA